MTVIEAPHPSFVHLNLPFMIRIIVLSTSSFGYITAFSQTVNKFNATRCKHFLTPPNAAMSRVLGHWMNGNFTWRHNLYEFAPLLFKK